MNRSNKSKIAVTLLSALAFGANAQAQDLNKNKITKTESFSIKSIKPAHLTEKKSDRNAVVRTSSFSILPKVVFCAIGVGEVYNEISGAVSGKTWYKGKYSIANGVKLMLNGNKDNQKPNPGDKKDKKNIDEEPEFLTKFKQAKITNDTSKSNLNSVYGQMENCFIRAYNKVSKSNDCNEFYDKKISEDDKPKANAILNFIAGEKKFSTNLSVSKVVFNGVFAVEVDSVKYFFALGAENKVKVVGSGRVILDIII